MAMAMARISSRMTPSKKNATSTPSALAILNRLLAPTRLVPLSYFWICWKVTPIDWPSLVWLMRMPTRRPRMRVPTCRSMGSGPSSETGFLMESNVRQVVEGVETHGRCVRLDAPYNASEDSAVRLNCQKMLALTKARQSRIQICRGFRRLCCPERVSRSSANRSYRAMLRATSGGWPHPASAADRSARLALVFSCLGHAYSHLFAPIFYVVVLSLETEFRLSHGGAVALIVAGNVLFGVAAPLAGWLGDRWSTTGMVGLFFVGTGAGMVLTGLARTPLRDRRGSGRHRPVRLDLPSGRHRLAGTQCPLVGQGAGDQRRVRRPGPGGSGV